MKPKPNPPTDFLACPDSGHGGLTKGPMKTHNQPKQLSPNRFRPTTRRFRWAGLALWLGLLNLALAADDPAITRQPTNLSVSLGATATFRVNVSGTSPFGYQWHYTNSGNSFPLDGVANPSALRNILNLTNVQSSDPGGYFIVVTNEVGRATSQVANLTVDPTFTKITTGVIVTDAEGSLSGNWADYDNDGYVDLFVANSDLNVGVRNTLYHNNGGTNFSRATASPVTTDVMRIWCAAWADYNNDGNVDLVTANLDGGILAQRLYRNNGDGSFTAVVDPALRSDTTRATCPWWFDYDNDGFLDLFMAKGMYLGGVANDCLFRNNGDGTFKKMTTAEVGPMLNDRLQSYLCYSADYDNDGRQELTVFHDPSYTSVFWDWQADGTFVKTTPIGAPVMGGASQSWGDYNNDGWLDAFGNSYNDQPTLLRNLGAGGFTNVTAALNVTAPVGGVNSPAWGDYDNDGWLDLFYTTYHGNPADTPNKLFHNNRDGTFTQILTGSPVWDGGRRYAPSWTDYDNDGFLDLFIAVGDAVPERNLVYRNNGNTNHWVKVKLDGRASNRSGIGARVRAQATINGQTFWQMREISCENAYAGQNGLLAHFGLGDATKVDTLRVEWPSGIVQEWKDVAVDQHLTKVESQNPPPPLAPQITASGHAADGTFQATVTYADTNFLCVFEASTNLVQWTKLSVRTNTTGTIQFDDPGATNRPARFYRVLVP